MARAGAGRPSRRRQARRPEREGRAPGLVGQVRRRGRPEREGGPGRPAHGGRRARAPERRGRPAEGRGSRGGAAGRECPPAARHGRRVSAREWGLPTPRSAFELLYGRNAVLEALRAGRRRPYALAIATGARAEGTLAAILELAQARGLPVREVERDELDRLADGHQGVALEASPYPYEEPDVLVERAGPDALYLLLDLIEDPQNLGTLLRTADAVGVAGVLIPAHRAAGVTPAVSNASAGAVEHLPLAQVSNLVQAMEELRRAGVWLAGLESLPEAQLYDQIDWRGPMALVVGSEGRGLRRLVRERCDLLVRLPMAGHVSSLNAAVAGSIALYHAWRRRASE